MESGRREDETEAETRRRLVGLIANISARHRPHGGLVPLPTPTPALLPDMPPKMAGTVRSARVKLLGPTVPCGPDAVWVPPGTSITFHDIVLPDGMVYVGQLEGVNGRGKEPAILNPGLRIQGNGSSYVPPFYWTSYAEWSPPIRRAYVNWLASGRKAANVSESFAALFFCGLERRLLASEEPVPAAEQVALRHELERLQACYPIALEKGRVQRLLTYLDLRTSDKPEAIYLDLERLRSLPRLYDALDPLLELALWHFAHRKETVPAPYAYLWLTHDSDYKARTAAERCPGEMEQLFLALFAQAIPKGVRPGLRKGLISSLYRPLSHTFAGTTLTSPLPKVVPHCVTRAALRSLRDLADKCADLLGSYSRYVGRHGDTVRNSIAAVSLLPEPLRLHHPALEIFKQQVQALMESGAVLPQTGLPGVAQAAQVKAPVLAALYTGDSDTTTLTRAPLLALLEALDGVGIAAEPDARRGGIIWKAEETVTLVRSTDPLSSTVSGNADDNALLRAILTLFVAASGGGQAAQADLPRLIQYSADFAARRGQEVSLARLAVFALHQVMEPDGRQPRRASFAGLTVAERALLAKQLTGLFAARMRRARFTMATLAEATQLYTILGCDAETTARLLHAAQTDDADEWTRVQPGSSLAEYALPAPPSVPDEPAAKGRRRTGPPAPVVAPPVAPPVFALDAAKIEAKIAESAQISALLHSIFTGDEAEPESERETATEAREPESGIISVASPSMEAVRGPLTPAQTAYLSQMLARSEWSADEADALARSLGLLPLAAREAINDAAFEIAGEALIEGDELLEINPYALEHWKEAYGLPV